MYVARNVSVDYVTEIFIADGDYVVSYFQENSSSSSINEINRANKIDLMRTATHMENDIVGHNFR